MEGAAQWDDHQRMKEARMRKRELDLKIDLQELIDTRRGMDEIRKNLSNRKTMTNT